MATALASCRRGWGGVDGGSTVGVRVLCASSPPELRRASTFLSVVSQCFSEGHAPLPSAGPGAQETGGVTQQESGWRLVARPPRPTDLQQCSPALTLRTWCWNQSYPFLCGIIQCVLEYLGTRKPCRRKVEGEAMHRLHGWRQEKGRQPWLARTPTRWRLQASLPPPGELERIMVPGSLPST